jgi:spermidine/putrescine-binding protein
VANTVHYATTNKSAREYVAKADLENPAIYAPEDVVKRSQALSDVGNALPLYDAAWTEIQAA